MLSSQSQLHALRPHGARLVDRRRHITNSGQAFSRTRVAATKQCHHASSITLATNHISKEHDDGFLSLFQLPFLRGKLSLPHSKKRRHILVAACIERFLQHTDSKLDAPRRNWSGFYGRLLEDTLGPFNKVK